MMVLVPLDGSAFAERALPWARLLTQGGDATLVLVRAVVRHAVRGAALVADRTEALEEAEQYLSTVAQRLLPGLRVETVVEDGSADEAILAAARQYHADLLVMATHTRPPLAGLLYGSVARALLMHSPVPILIVRSWSPESAGGPTDVRRRILVPLDGSPFGEEALPPALGIARTLNAVLALVRVVPPPARLLSGTLGLLLAATEPDQEEHISEAEQYLSGVRDQIAPLATLVPVQTDVRVGDPLRAIVDAERDSAATLVVMATHGRTGLEHVLLGSSAEAVLRAGTVPVLFVRPRILRSGTGDADQVDRGDTNWGHPDRPTEPDVSENRR